MCICGVECLKQICHTRKTIVFRLDMGHDTTSYTFILKVTSVFICQTWESQEEAIEIVALWPYAEYSVNALNKYS